MKSFKKSLAVLLAVLMVVFSFPFSAMALENPNNTDGTYSDDYDVELHAYIMDYSGYDSYGPYSDTAGATLDPTSISTADLNSADGAFVIYFTFTGVDNVAAWQLTLDYDDSIMVPCNYARRSFSSGLDLGPDAIMETAKTYHGSVVEGGSTAALFGKPQLYMSTAGHKASSQFDAETDIGDGVMLPGQVVGCAAFQLLSDTPVDLTKVLTVKEYENCFVQTTAISNDNKNIYPYGTDTLNNTQFTWPEWGLVPASEPTTVDYVYTMADGSQKTVTVDAGATPTAPANTADTAAVSNNNGTHTHTTYSWPEFSADVTAYTEVATPVTADCTLVANDDAVAPGHSTDGSKASSTCSVCGYTKAGDVDPATGHTWDAGVVTAATCVAKGYTTYTCTNADCADDETAVLVTDYTEIDPENHAGPLKSANNEVASTCHTAGHASDQVCTACGKTAVTGEALPLDPTNHEGNTVDAGNDKASTCITAGYTGDKVCDVCGEIVEKGTDLPLNPENHEGNVVDAGNAKEATRSEDGYTGDKICDACKEIVVKGEVIPALGVMITVANSELGSATLNGEATTGEAQKVAYASDYTLTATANAGAEFVGWMVNGKMVSTDATYTTAAYADTTYAPVFAETENTFTVTFVDVFNNVIAVLSADEVAALTELPAPYAVSGYTFTGYDKTLEEVKALDASTVVTAGFEKNAEEVYNVSAPGCAIYVNGVLADSDSVMVPHDARVAVMPANDDVATSWTVNGAEAAYGEKYTFYVTTDVTVSYSTADVTVAPTVIAVNGNGEKVEGTNKVRFLASRTVTAGYELVESGFVYGKNVAAEDLTLENVGNGCYLYKNSNMAADGQFALTFGVSNGTACARAYMIVKNTATGETSVVYAAPQING